MKITEVTKDIKAKPEPGKPKRRNPGWSAAFVNRGGKHKDPSKYNRKDKHKGKRDY